MPDAILSFFIKSSNPQHSLIRQVLLLSHLFHSFSPPCDGYLGLHQIPALKNNAAMMNVLVSIPFAPEWRFLWDLQSRVRPGALQHMSLILPHTADCLPAQLLPVHIPTTRGARERFSSPHPYSPCKVALLPFAVLMARRWSPIVIQFAFLSLLVSFLPLPLPAPWCKPPLSPWELHNLSARGSASILSCPSFCSHTSK